MGAFCRSGFPGPPCRQSLDTQTGREEIRCSCTLRQTQDANSLSLRERARLRGNETQPTKTAGRILPAQRERSSESGSATTSSEKPVDGRRARGRKRSGVSSVPSPSPRPLPWGEGESPAAAWRIQRAARFSPACCLRQQPLESAGEKTT